MKVAIVDDSKFIRMVISQIVKSDSNFHIAWEAEDGQTAFLENEKNMADIIISDMEMPIMDGVGLLKSLKEKDHKSKCLIISGFHKSDGEKIIEAFRMGAIGFISKNRIGKGINLHEFRHDILEHLNAIKVQTENKILFNKKFPLEKNARIKSRADFLVLAGSAGSLEPLEEIVKKIHCFDIPIIIAIHMPVGVDEFFISRMKKFYEKHDYKMEISNSGELSKNRITMLKGGHEATFINVSDKISIGYHIPKIERLFTPDINLFLKGAFEKNKCCDVVILSGLCSDACEGSKVHKENGGLIFVQDPNSAVAKTMPLSVISEGNYDFIMEPGKIGDLLIANYNLTKVG